MREVVKEELLNEDVLEIILTEEEMKYIELLDGQLAGGNSGGGIFCMCTS